jgi:hypothetical protein
MKTKLIIVGIIVIAGITAVCFWLKSERPMKYQVAVSPQKHMSVTRLVQDSVQKPKPPNKPAVLVLTQAQRIARVIGGEGDGSYFTRNLALQGLGKNLSSEERTSLYAFLESVDQPESLSNDELYALKNDLITVLRNQNQKPAGLSDVLVSLYRNPKQDVVIRDYAIQHLSSYYSIAQNKPQIQQAMWDALKENKTSIAGTALLALNRLAPEHPEIDSKLLGSEILRMAQDSKADESPRTSAIALCAQLKLKEALPTALELAQGQHSVPLRAASIASIGDLGNADQIEFLKQVAVGPDNSVRVAAQAALSRLQKRIGG